MSDNIKIKMLEEISDLISKGNSRIEEACR